MQKKVGRNDPCPCGSGRKYKKCCANKTLAGNSTELTIQFKEAQRAFLKGQFELANSRYKKILSIKPDYADALHYLGQSELRLGRISEGMQSIRASIALQPDEANFQSNYGLLLLEQGQLTEAEKYFCNALGIDANNVNARYNLCVLLDRTKRYPEAKRILEKLTREFPDDFEIQSLYARNLKGLEEWSHSASLYKSALKLKPDDISVNLEYCKVLEMLGRYESVSQVYEKLIKLCPDNVEVLLHRATYCEANNNLDEAEHWLSLAENKPGVDKARLFFERGKLSNRKKDFALALEWFGKIDENDLDEQFKVIYFFELGKTYDKVGMFKDAFAAFRKGNKLKQQIKNSKYNIDGSEKRRVQINSVLTRDNLAAWSVLSPHASNNGPEPIFIVGFTRSGSTLLEQIIASHPNIEAGGEYNFIIDIEDEISDIFGTGKQYPEAMLDLHDKQNKDKLVQLKKLYLNKLKAFKQTPGTQYWVTDKRLLNSLELGLIYLLFPESPILHVVRHPLDVCLSSYFTNFSAHAYTDDLLTTAHKFVQVINQINHTRTQIELRYQIVRYEDLVKKPEENIKTILDFIGEPWDDACMNFYSNKRVARTASYAQVNQPLYTSSIHRYKNYQKQIEEIIPILESVMDPLGYKV